jgi:hypothetical protein
MHELRDYIIIGLAMIEGSIGLNLFLLPHHTHRLQNSDSQMQ